jgi:hypothetical protein
MKARQRVVRELESAAIHIGDIPRHELQILLRRAALLLRNVPEPPDEEWVPVEDSNNDDPGEA